MRTEATAKSNLSGGPSNEFGAANGWVYPRTTTVEWSSYVATPLRAESATEPTSIVGGVGGGSVVTVVGVAGSDDVAGAGGALPHFLSQESCAV